MSRWTPRALFLCLIILPLLAVGCSPSGQVDQSTLFTKGAVISFPTEDNVELQGRIFGQGDVAVVLAHEYPADQSSWYDFARTLASNGYSALTFDFRGYGDSGGKKEIGFIDRDVTAALKVMGQLGKTKVFLVGASMGGTASLKVAARENVLGVITLSAPSTFQGLSAVNEVPQVKAPKLFLASQGDTPAADSVKFFTDKAPDPKQMNILSGNAHGTDMLKGDQGSQVSKLIVDFLRQNSK